MKIQWWKGFGLRIVESMLGTLGAGAVLALLARVTGVLRGVDPAVQQLAGALMVTGILAASAFALIVIIERVRWARMTPEERASDTEKRLAYLDAQVDVIRQVRAARQEYDARKGAEGAE